MNRNPGTIQVNPATLRRVLLGLEQAARPVTASQLRQMFVPGGTHMTVGEIDAALDELIRRRQVQASLGPDRRYPDSTRTVTLYGLRKGGAA